MLCCNIQNRVTEDVLRRILVILAFVVTVAVPETVPAATPEGRAAPPATATLSWTSKTGDKYGPGDGRARSYTTVGYAFDIGAKDPGVPALGSKPRPTQIDIIVGHTDPVKFPNPSLRLSFVAPGFQPLIPGTYTVGSVNGIHDTAGTTASGDFSIEKQPGCTNLHPGGTITVTKADYESLVIPIFRGTEVVYHPLAFAMHFELQCTTTSGLMVGDFVMTDAPIPGATPFDPTTITDGGGSGGTGSGGTGSGGTGSGSGTPTPAGPTVVLTDSVLGSPILMTNVASIDVPFSTFIPSTVTGDVTLSAVTDADNLLASVSPSLIKAGDAGDAVLTIRTTETTMAGDHAVTITASDGVTPSSATVFVSVLCDPPFILGLDQLKTTTVSAGRPALLSVKPTGSGPFTYQWFTGSSGLVNFPLAGGTTANFTTSAINDTAQYWVRVTNPCGSVNSQTVTVNVAAGAKPNSRR
jgi:Ig-like domain CHU_C associated